MWSNKTIVLGVCGGIAAYKAISVCSQLTQLGANVKVIMTKSAQAFVQPLSFQAISRNTVAVDVLYEQDPSVIAHIDLADHADLVVVAPATANFIGKYANGIADDMLTTTLMATKAPVLIAPAMNVHMFEHPAVQTNLAVLEQRGISVIQPGTGQLACGYVGKGRLAEPDQIVKAVEEILFRERRSGLLQGKSVLVTAGGTRERIDPVRYITNDSSGKMGYAIADEAAAMGAKVTLVTASLLEPSAGIQTIRVESSAQMYDAVMKHYQAADLIIKAAAVSDYRPVQQAAEKIKKKDDIYHLELVKTRDILLEVGHNKLPRQVLVGFAAETSQLEHFAMAKLKAKKCDLIVANNVSQVGAGFESDTNVCSIYDQNGLVIQLPLMSKREVAHHIIEIAAARLQIIGETP